MGSAVPSGSCVPRHPGRLACSRPVRRSRHHLGHLLVARRRDRGRATTTSARRRWTLSGPGAQRLPLPLPERGPSRHPPSGWCSARTSTPARGRAGAARLRQCPDRFGICRGIGRSARSVGLPTDTAIVAIRATNKNLIVPASSISAAQAVPQRGRRRAGRPPSPATYSARRKAIVQPPIPMGGGERLSEAGLRPGGGQCGAGRRQRAAGRRKSGVRRARRRRLSLRPQHDPRALDKLVPSPALLGQVFAFEPRAEPCGCCPTGWSIWTLFRHGFVVPVNNKAMKIDSILAPGLATPARAQRRDGRARHRNLRRGLARWACRAGRAWPACSASRQ